MFGYFGPEARRVIWLAEDHARALGRAGVGPEHLLLAVLAVDDRGVLEEAGLAFDEVRESLADAPGSESEWPPDRASRNDPHLPLRLREVLRAAFRHAATLGHPQVTPLHLALALVDDPPGEVAAALRRLGVEATPARDAVRAALLVESAPDDTVVELRRRPVAVPAGEPKTEAGLAQLRFSAAP